MPSKKALLTLWLPWTLLIALCSLFLSEDAEIALSEAFELASSSELRPSEDNHLLEGKGNQKVRLFSESKTILKELYTRHQVTFYCPCRFIDMHQIDFSSCNYTAATDDMRRIQRIEWEHLVTAYEFGHKLPEWRYGDRHCVNKSGKKFHGRKCAAQVSPTFRAMEADLHNLVPTIGEINAIRSNFPMAELPSSTKSIFGKCETKIAGGKIYPRAEDRGTAARAYLYMYDTYPFIGSLSRHDKKMFTEWDKKNPPSSFEIWRNKKIKVLQGNSNRFIDAYGVKTISEAK